MNKNKFVFYRNDFKRVHFEFNPDNPDSLDKEGYAYFGRVLYQLNQILPAQGLNFFITGWTTQELPSFPEKTIVCILQDEWARKPKYINNVDIIFRTCGLSPIVTRAFKHGNLNEKFVNFLAQSKALLKDGSGRTNAYINSVLGKKCAQTFLIPLGYYANENINFIPFEQRENDIFFAGSIEHKKKSFYSITRPKEYARNRMLSALNSTQKNYPSLKVKKHTTNSFADSMASNNQEYLKQIMNSKICLIPRGANLETFRYYEAIRYGCIPIAEIFPQGYFYDRAPIVQVNSWSELSDVAINILNNADKQFELHVKSINWWKDVCSEAATARIMKTHISKVYGLE